MYSLEVVEYYKQFINPKDHEIFDQIFDIFITKENIINLDILAKYLNILKKNLKKTLVNSYIRDVDYFIESDPGWRAINREAIFITIDCAKRLCMRSNSNVGEIIRDYFILCEEISREYMMDGIEYKLDQTDGELFGAGPTNFDKRNCVYVIAIMGDQGPPIYKIGKTSDLNRRYREHWYSIPNFKGVVRYKYFDKNSFLEKCIHGFLADRQINVKSLNNKNLVEIFDIDLDIIDEIFEKCDDFITNTKITYRDHRNDRVLPPLICDNHGTICS